MGLGFDEEPHPVVRVIGIAFGAATGAAGGFLAELVATAFTDTMVAALPGLRGSGSVAFYVTVSLVPAAIFAGLARSRRADASAKAMGIAALAVLAFLVAGELGGFFVLDRSHRPFYLVPAFSR